MVWLMYNFSYSMFFLSFLGWWVVVSLVGFHGVFLLEWVFVRVGGCDMGLILLIDMSSLVFSSTVFLIAGCVFFYSGGYMSNDDNIVRFGVLVMLFVMSMIVVIISPSLISLLLGWDGLGLVSYCLVIYYQNFKSYNAGMITGLTNRVGDVGLLSMVGLMFSYGGWDFFSLCGGSVEFMWVVLVVLASFTSSAQLPFSAWLPAAMAAPTPVSALVHSSTLVTAGVYLLIRFSGVIESFWLISVVLVYGGVITMVMAGLSASFEMDLSKIIALSTLSQLGLMVFSVGLGLSQLAFFHLVVHALFSALLFMGGGKLIHIFNGQQDIRFMGGLGVSMPLSVVSLNVANFSLCGVPFMCGFYSSDLILELGGAGNLNYFLVGLFVMGTIFTCMYSVSVYFIGLFSGYGGGMFVWEDRVLSYYVPLVVMSLGGMISGASLLWGGLVESEELPVVGLSSVWVLIVVFVGLIIGVGSMKFVSELGGNQVWSDYFYSMWHIFDLSVYWNEMVLGVCDIFIEVGDYSWGEVLGGQGLYFTGQSLSSVLVFFREGDYSVFMFFIIFWGVVLGVVGI